MRRHKEEMRRAFAIQLRRLRELIVDTLSYLKDMMISINMTIPTASIVFAIGSFGSKISFIQRCLSALVWD
ncbi:hypothetical protein [Enterococcus avium]|uniref:hypothetical protein n=1 Tax=Enterococcus avium TaxID=33945 RepID=UPI000C9BE1E0|nr:hypothetical protein [Enterococcus avium]PNE44059.1 hypothetical protein AUF14_18255 [Enterococcus avium]